MIWVGSVLTLGYVAAPVLFSMLDRTSAGSVAAQLFRIEGIPRRDLRPVVAGIG